VSETSALVSGLMCEWSGERLSECMSDKASGGAVSERVGG